MASFKIVVSDPENRKAYQIEVEKSKAMFLVGKKIGEEIDATLLGLPGYVLKITGGTDKDGFPMHPNVEGMVKKKILLEGPPCFHPEKKGQRKKKTVRGNVISEDVVQINCKVVKKGEKPLEELVPKKEKKEEGKK
ncbi:MAG: 30S ribosomal protein S6e [Candidatus Aenigmarchaeota archaeon]|nr:30S ribosomal protein S6e [Candidatus Aenigmarchaeota archaeon]MDW8160146.1 30S ribosomal protein S6e [Candidatus Aenigmarchaeota archaeon]